MHRNKKDKAAEAPKKKHRVRRVLFLGALAGAVTALLKSPFRSKLKGHFGHSEAEAEEPAPITLPPARARKAAHSHEHPSES